MPNMNPTPKEERQASGHDLNPTEARQGAELLDAEFFGALGWVDARRFDHGRRVARPQRFQGGAQHLPALAESGRNDTLERGQGRIRQRFAARYQFHDG